jgi:uncharacterized protein YuzE
MTVSLALGGSQDIRTTPCKRIDVSPDTCYLRFQEAAVECSQYIGTSTREDMVIVDYDASGRIVGIELVGDEKPCQQQ